MSHAYHAWWAAGRAGAQNLRGVMIVRASPRGMAEGERESPASASLSRCRTLAFGLTLCEGGRLTLCCEEVTLPDLHLGSTMFHVEHLSVQNLADVLRSLSVSCKEGHRVWKKL